MSNKGASAHRIKHDRVCQMCGHQGTVDDRATCHECSKARGPEAEKIEIAAALRLSAKSQACWRCCLRGDWTICPFCVLETAGQRAMV